MLTVVGTLALDTLGVVPRLPPPETTAAIERLVPDAPGGTGGNVAMALARLGAPPRLLAAVGPDFAGSAYERALRDAGVDLSGLARVADEPTSRAYVFVERAGGGQTTCFFAGASRAMGKLAPPKGRAHFAAGEISAYPALMRDAEWVSFDPGQETFHRDLSQIRACLPLVDVLFVNRHERARLGVSPGDVPILVETRGAEGTAVHANGQVLTIPAVPAAPLDPTGAGDAHRAGFLHALDRGADLATAARFAAVLGAFAVEKMGAQAGLPTLDQALARYEASFGSRPF